MAEGGRDSPLREESRIVVSVDEEKRGNVTLALKVRGLKARGMLPKFFAKLGKPEDPGPLMSNAEIKNWSIEAKGMDVRLVVRTAKKRKEKAMTEEEKEESFEKFHLIIRQFPCEVIPESARYDVRESDSGKGFIFISLDKVEAGVSWKQFQKENGAIDADPLDPPSE